MRAYPASVPCFPLVATDHKSLWRTLEGGSGKNVRITSHSRASYLLPPKKPFASRRICERMNGSGSAPITMAPGWPHGVQQTILAFGVLRGMTVMLGVGFGYPCWTYAPCLFTFRASADEETEMPRAQISNPSMTDVLLLLAMTMEFLHRLLSAPETYGACCLAKPAESLLAVSLTWGR